MAQLGTTFDASSVAPMSSFDPLPAGEYVMQIVQSELRATKAGDGQYLWLEFDVLDGEHAGRKHWDRLNLWNQNSQTVEIANRTLSSICHAVGVMAVSDSEELHFKPMIAKIKVKQGRDGQLNNSATYHAADGSAAPAQVPSVRPPVASTARPGAAPASRPAPAAAPGKKPWERHKPPVAA